MRGASFKVDGGGIFSDVSHPASPFPAASHSSDPFLSRRSAGLREREKENDHPSLQGGEKDLLRQLAILLVLMVTGHGRRGNPRISDSSSP